MITTNFQAYGTDGFKLRLRLYLNGETKFIAVNQRLSGKLLKRHWNQKKQLFIPSAPFSAENNATLVAFKTAIDRKAAGWNGGLTSFIISVKNKEIKDDGELTEDGQYLYQVMEWVIENAKLSKHADGTLCGTFETYEKVVRRLEEYCIYKRIQYRKIKMSEIDATLVNDMLEWIIKTKNGKGQYFSCMFRAALNKADKEGWFDVKKVEKCKWIKRVRSVKTKYETLTSDQCHKFINLRPDELPKGKNSLLYRDFCIFLLYTCMSPCDAIALQYKNIQKINGVNHFIFNRRKIEKRQAVSCTVPINDKMQAIMDYWKPRSRDGYIFPIRSKERLANITTNNFDIKSFGKKCNVWLKKIGAILGCDFPLHNYVFRHTAITNYISAGASQIYIANLAGTSIENCRTIYYNNRGDERSRDLVLNIKFNDV